MTGGAITPLKCWWNLIQFQCDDFGGWKYITVDSDHMYQLMVKDVQDNTKVIKYLFSKEAQEILGVFLLP